MDATIVARTESGLTVQVVIPFKDSMLDAEDAIQDALNQAGVLATAEILEHFDTDGKPITVAGSKMTTKGQLLKDYQTRMALN